MFSRAPVKIACLWSDNGSVRPHHSYNPDLYPLHPRAAERRRHGRLRTEGVNCSLGEVVDLSASGMRVLRKGRRSAEVGETVALTLDYEGFTLSVDARVVRLEKAGFRRHIYGLEFQQVNPDVQDQLTHLARIATYQRILPT